MSEISTNIESYKSFRQIEDVLASKDDDTMKNHKTNCEYNVRKIESTLSKMEELANELKLLKSSMENDIQQVDEALSTIVEIDYFFAPVVTVQNVDKFLDNYSTRTKKQVKVELKERHMKKITYKDGSEQTMRGKSSRDYVVNTFIKDWSERKIANQTAKDWAKEYNCELEKVK